MTTQSKFAFTTETIIYAGTMAHGLKEKLYGVVVNGSTIEIIKASCDAEYKPKGQRNATLTVNSNVNLCIDVDTKGRASWNKFSEEREIKKIIEETFEGVTKVIGNTFECKDLIKALGFSWNGSEKCWTR